MSTTVVEPEVESQPSAPVPGETCPRCHTTQSWGMASWCPNCGYYPSVGEDDVEDMSWKDHVVEDTAEAEPENIWQSIPAWFWIMMAGVIGIMVSSVTIRLLLPEEDSPRGIIALVQLGVGFLSFAIAHGIASREAMKNDPRINLTDVGLAWFSVWQPTITQLPHTCKRIWSIAWGLMAMVTAVTVIGGIDYSAPFRGEEKKGPNIAANVIQNVASAAKAQAAQQPQDMSMEDALTELNDPDAMMDAANAGGAPASMEDAVQNLAGMPEQLEELTGDLPLDDPEALQEMLVDLKVSTYVYGVVINSKRQPVGLVFAANTKGRDQHVAEIMADKIPQDSYMRIVRKLYMATQSTPEIPSDRTDVVWVAPEVSCRLKYKGIAEDGTLIEPEFDAIVISQMGRRRGVSTSQTGRSAVNR